jgi:hypothetical protein
MEALQPERRALQPELEVWRPRMEVAQMVTTCSQPELDVANPRRHGIRPKLEARRLGRE